MRYVGLTWKFKMCLMALALALGLLLLYISYTERGYLRAGEITAAIVSFVIACLLIIFCDRSWRKHYERKVEIQDRDTGNKQ